MGAKILILCFAAIFFLATSVAEISSSSVTMNLAISVADKSTDNLSYSENYSSSHNTANSAVVALVSGGSYGSDGSTNSSYSPTANMVTLRQTAEGNRFIIAFTNGTAATISGKSGSFGNGRILSSVFGELHGKKPEKYTVFIVSEHDNINIANSTFFSGSTEIMIRNMGMTARGPNLTVERIG